MKFRTTAVSNITGVPLTHVSGAVVKRPVIEVELLNADGDSLFDSLALIDSGADTSIVNAEYALALDIDLTKITQTTIMGVGPEPIPAWASRVDIRLKKLKQEVKLPVYFVDSKSVGILLGREVLFDEFRFAFNLAKDLFEITRNK